MVRKLHDDDLDPNFALLSARDDEELRRKGSGHAGVFVKKRECASLPALENIG